MRPTTACTSGTPGRSASGANDKRGNCTMGPVTFITRFVAHLPDSGERGREEREQVAARINALGLTLLRHQPCLLAVASTKTPTGSAVTTLLDVFPGTAASARMAT